MILEYLLNKAIEWCKTRHSTVRKLSEIEKKVEEIKMHMKKDLDGYADTCKVLQGEVEGYDHMILENMIEQIEI